MPDETSNRRVAQSLAAAIGRSGSGDDVELPVAATVVMLRDGAAGVEVLMIERPDRGSFAGAWVFPGGKLEPADRLGGGESEEAVARRAGVRETLEETGLTLAPQDLTTLSCWDPPPGLALRIRTWFFLATVPADDASTDAALSLSPDEAVAAEWVRPADALARHGRGEFHLYPPTWVTLHGLTAHPDADSVVGEARVGGIERFETVARRGGEGPMLVWQGDAEYDADAGDEASTAPSTGARHRLEIGALPWIYTRAV